jgi:Skp family chaperone for outer membrane proteins
MFRMKVVSSLALGATLIAGSAYAQTGQTQSQTPPPAPQKPATPPPAGTTTPPPAPVPLPEGTKFAIINPEFILSSSAAGKAITGQVQALFDKRNAEIQSLQTQGQALQQKKATQSAMLSQAAVAQIDKDIEKLNLDIQYKRTSAETEINNLQNELYDELATKMGPILEAYAKEKGLLAVFDVRSGVTWAAAGMDISAEIVKRMDAQIKK